MSRIVIQNKCGIITVTNRLSYPETVNERVCNAIACGMPGCFLPVSVIRKRRKTQIVCCVQGLWTLEQYFGGLVSKEMFLDLVYQIAVIIQNCEGNMISENNLDLQKDRIFIDPRTRLARCIYWPVVNNLRSEPPHIFLRQLPYGISFDPREQNAYLQEYVSFFNGFDPFSIKSFERLLLRLQGKNASGGACAPSGSLSGGSAVEKKAQNAVFSKKNIEYDPFSNIRASSGAERGQVRKPERGGRDASPESGIRNADVQSPPAILQIRTGEKYEMDRPVIQIGSEPAICDLFIQNNTFISRHHADIVQKDGRYYVVDKNSTNKTFVDGKQIAPETEVEIFDGTRIRLANEEFSFSLGNL